MYKFNFLILSFLILGGCEIKNAPDSCITTYIKDIGGCDKSGYCGVILGDGTVSESLKPIKEEIVRYCAGDIRVRSTMTSRKN